MRKSSKSAYYQEELTKAQTQISLLETKLQQRIQANTDLEKEINDLRHNAAHASGAGSSDKDPRRRMSVRSAAVATKGNEVVESFEDVVEDLYERLVLHLLLCSSMCMCLCIYVMRSYDVWYVFLWGAL